MLIKAPTFAKSGRAWRPFVFSNLERVSKRHATLVKNLEWLLPNVRSTGEVSSSVRTRLQEMLEEQVSMQAEYVHVVPMSQLQHYIASPTFLAVLTPQPNKTRGLLEVELGLAHHAIDLLLGGAGDAVALRPLTDIEEGVMTYVIIETLKALSPTLDPSLPKLRIEGVVRGFDEIQGLIPENENLAVVQLKAVFGAHSGYVRLVIPEDVLATANPPTDAAVRRARRAADAEAHLGRLRNVKTTVRAEIGNVEISAADLAQLRERDVVLVDALTCRPDQGEGGTAKLKIGLGRTGHLDAEVVVEDGQFKATVTGINLGGPPPPGGPAEAEESAGESPGAPDEDADDESTTPGSIRGKHDMEDAQSAGGADLMNDIPLQIAVELGRVATTAEEVVALKVGHVFDLNRVAGEPLDLSVNGKVVARGELVEIDGNLGVRILSLAG
ncbi:MAG: type III secretion system cytoplasmic ring protein SctQ [Myxococcota bacterium]